MGGSRPPWEEGAGDPGLCGWVGGVLLHAGGQVQAQLYLEEFPRVVGMRCLRVDGVEPWATRYVS